MSYPGGGISVMGLDPDAGSIHACMYVAMNKQCLALLLRSGD